MIAKCHNLAFGFKPAFPYDFPYMTNALRAVIDVGTNSVKLLIAEVTSSGVHPVHEESRQTRLGQGFYETHELQPAAVAHTAEAVRVFADTARAKNCPAIRVIATSAARDAVNPTALTSAILQASGLETEIISGAREADWVFQGVATDTELAKHPLLLLDVGGGSTEFILGHGQKKNFAHSFPLGTVRLMEQFPVSDPPTSAEFAACSGWLKHFLHAEVRSQLLPALEREQANGTVQLVGTGGTTSILARMEKKLDRFDRDRIESTVLTFDQLVAHRQNLWFLPLAERKQIEGLPKLRADVILTGVLIFETVMAEFGFPELRVSTRGLRFAAVMAG